MKWGTGRGGVFYSVDDSVRTGADGLAKYAVDPLTDTPGVRLNITIVAVNIAPTISAAANIQVVENVMFAFSLSVLDANDVDSDEVITSTLALQNWLGLQWNAPYVNKIRVTLELQGYGNGLGRGLLYFDASATQISVVSNSTYYFVSIVPVFPQHDTCAAWPMIDRPPIYACDAASAANAAGKSCSGPLDLQTCNLVASGHFKVNVSGLLSSFNSIAQNFSNSTVWLARVVPGLVHLLTRPEGVILKIVTGTGRGQSSKVNSAVDKKSYTQITLAIPFAIMPDSSSIWSLSLIQPHCQNIGIELSTICITSSQKNKQNYIGSSCPNINCSCIFQSTCSQDGKILIFLNRTNNAAVQQYFQQLTSSLAVYRMTCGAMPVYRGLNFSLGKPCSVDADCNSVNFPKCVPGVSCRCCANITAICSTNADCQIYQSASMCGCQRGLVPWKMGQTVNYYCCANLSALCSVDSDCYQYVNGSHCGCISGYGICNDTFGMGNPCTYRGVAQLSASGSYVMYSATSCQAPLYSYEGTEDANVFTQLSFDVIGYKVKDSVFDSQGSTRIEFYAPRRFAVLAMSSMKYLTNNPNFPNYNRLYRIPVKDRDPATFDINADDYDQLFVTVNDMGNSGGGVRSIQSVSAVSKIVSAARNNAPFVTGPSLIVAHEDIPYSILNAIRINDPDEGDYGFNDSLITATHLDGMGFIVNLTVENGCLFINEGFFLKGTEYAGRGMPILGDPHCSLVADFYVQGVDACTIRLKDYGQPKYGLHAVKCADITSGSCTDQIYDPCYSYLTEVQQPWCYARMCAKFLSFEGRFPDVNQILSNITYLSDPQFNTYYGYSEQILIQVTDNGILGDIITPLSGSLVIPIEVIAVNDAPVIGRLQSQQCINLNNDGSVNFDSPNTENRVFLINNDFDFVDVNEDTTFTIYPDRLWILDNDAEEAEIWSKYVGHCEGNCASPFDPVRGTYACFLILIPYGVHFVNLIQNEHLMT